MAMLYGCIPEPVDKASATGLKHRQLISPFKPLSRQASNWLDRQVLSTDLAVWTVSITNFNVIWFVYITIFTALGFYTLQLSLFYLA